jgi:hypothetical protein
MLWNDGCIIAGVSDFKAASGTRGIDVRQLGHVAETGSVAASGRDRSQ